MSQEKLRALARFCLDNGIEISGWDDGLTVSIRTEGDPYVTHYEDDDFDRAIQAERPGADRAGDVRCASCRTRAPDEGGDSTGWEFMTCHDGESRLLCPECILGQGPAQRPGVMR